MYTELSSTFIDPSCRPDEEGHQTPRRQAEPLLRFPFEQWTVLARYEAILDLHER
jgi:hypothetical protein